MLLSTDARWAVWDEDPAVRHLYNAENDTGLFPGAGIKTLLFNLILKGYEAQHNG